MKSFGKEKELKKVLIVAYYFPPRPGSGSVRPMGLAKYLPRFGWKPVILTAKLPGPAPAGVQVIDTEYIDILSKLKGYIGYRRDIGLHEQLGLSVGKNGSGRSLLSRLISRAKGTIAFPDEHVGWVKFAVQKGKDLLEKEDIQVIMSTSSPVTTHLIARRLKMESGKPWIADLRDLWTQNHYYRFGSFRHFMEKRLELWTLSRANALVTAHPLVDRLSELHRNIPIHWIANGFDPADFLESSVVKSNHNKMILTYTGLLYHDKRDPEPLFRALSDLFAEGEMKRTDIEIRFIGPFEEWLAEEVKKFNLQDVVKIESQVSREEALQKQMESSLLLILTWDSPDEVNIYPGKVFEYLGARRPILAIGGPGGVVKDLLEKTQSGLHISGIAQLKKTLIEYYKLYKTHGTIPYNPVQPEVQKYSSQVMAQKFAEVFDKALLS